VSFVASKMPGVGDPWTMPMDTFFGLIKAYCDASHDEHAAASGDSRAFVEAQMRRSANG